MALLALGMVCGALTGCGIGVAFRSSTTTATLGMKGLVTGGQQPVSGSLVQLWAAGQTGNGSAATPLVKSGEYYPGGAPGCTPSSTQTCYSGVYTDANGNFTITGDYTCPSATTQVYLTSQGGNPGLTAGTNNAALLLVDALGSCGNLSSATTVTIDEVTTAAAAWSLGQFMDLNGNIGSSATNGTGLANAFLNTALLADPGTGYAANISSNLYVETGKLYALANALASCVNSDGTAGCTALFQAATPSSGTMPTNTLAAAVNVVRNPANNVAAVYNASSPQAPFPGSLATAPNDWTMSLTITGGGINYPSAVDVDSFGNVWVANYFGVLSAFSPQGTPLNSSGYAISGSDEVYGLTIDTSNNIWVTNEETPHHGLSGSVTHFYGASSGSAMGSYVGGTQYLYGSDTDFPLALAADTNGNVFVANYANSSASVFNSSGTEVGANIGGNGNAAFPVALTADANHGVWLANQGDTTVSHLDSNGNLLGRVNCCDGANGIATDAYGNAWIANYYGKSVSEVTSANVVAIAGDTQGGITYPSTLTVDAAQNVWVANFRGASFTELAGNGGTTAAGTGLSPANGFGRDAFLVDPFGIAVDASGNLWLTSFNGNSLSMFFGVAAPTATPTLPTPKAP
jgi:streptogramin lyase